MKDRVKKDAKLAEKLKLALRHFSKTHAISLGQSIYKIRIAGLHKGKSGGYRVYLLEENPYLVPLVIFSKSEQSTLSDKELKGHIKAIKIELALGLS